MVVNYGLIGNTGSKLCYSELNIVLLAFIEMIILIIFCDLLQ